MGPASDDVAPSPGGESVVSSKRGASPDGIGSGAGGGSAAEAAAKRKKMGPGSRGVANLTPEQLAKKRENGASLSTLLFHAGGLALPSCLTMALTGWGRVSRANNDSSFH